MEVKQSETQLAAWGFKRRLEYCVIHSYLNGPTYGEDLPLQEKITQLLQDGWVLQGGVSTTFDPSLEEPDILQSQALVRAVIEKIRE